ncbi:MAG: hypothetical protein ABIT47_02675 [Candidatus Paceibacterota bacterium]
MIGKVSPFLLGRINMSAAFEEVVVEAAVPAKAAVIKNIMVLTVDQETKDVLDANRKTSRLNRIFYPVLLVILLIVFFYFDPLGVMSAECTNFYHGECDDGRGFVPLVFVASIMFVLMIPAIDASHVRSKMKELLLKEAGWDGTSEYRLHLKVAEATKKA